MSTPEEAPVLDVEDAQRIAADLWGLADPQARDLGSHQDRNFLIASGATHVVLKVANCAVPELSLDAQDAAMLALRDLPIRAPRPLVSLGGALREVVDLSGTRHSVRILTFVHGSPMTGSRYFAPVTARRFGALAGRVSAALAGFSHPGAELPNQWDVRRSAEVVHELLPALDGALAGRVEHLSAASQRALDAVAPDLPMQVIHADITDFNVVADPGPDARPVPAGIIDFGDLMRTWRAAEVAVTICALLVKDRLSPLRVAEDVLAGFLTEQPLTPVEVAAVWPMVAARACAGLVSTAHQLGSEPGNPYLHANLAVDRAVFEVVADLPLELGSLAMLRAAGMLPSPGPAPSAHAPLISDLGPVSLIDLSTTSPLLDEAAWSDPARVRAAVGGAVGGPGDPCTGVIPYGQAHLHRSRANSLGEPATVHVGVDVLLPRGTQVLAPWAGTLTPGDPRETRLVGEDGWDLVLCGAEPLGSPGAQVSAGAPLATVTDSTDPALPDHVHVQVAATGVGRSPTHVPASQAQLWAHLCPDPSPLLGLPLRTRHRDPGSCCVVGSRPWRRCRSTTGPIRRSSSAAGGTTSSTCPVACTSTGSTTSRCWATATRLSQGPSTGLCAP